MAVLAATVTLSAWAVASPVGGSPDDDFHLISAWCSFTSSGPCVDSSTADSREVPPALVNVACFAFDSEASAACQGDSLSTDVDPTQRTARGNFDATYPPVFYAVDGLLASKNLEQSALAMRVLNLGLFVALATAASVLLSPRRRAATHLAWLVTAVPLTLFLIPSNNPSGWTLSGIAVAVPSLFGAIESQGRRRLALAAVCLAAAVMALGSRADAATYITAGLVGAALLAGLRTQRSAWPIFAGLGIVVVASLIVIATTGQAKETIDGLGEAGVAGRGGIGLLGYNVLHLPALWAGGFGATGLGWLDTEMPPAVTWATSASFIGVIFVSLRHLTRTHKLVLGGTAAALVLLPLVVLQQSGDVVGANVQPRYLWPLIALLALFVLLRPDGQLPSLGRVQLLLVGLALTGANSAALYSTMRRFITGVDAHWVSLNVDVEWWWPGIGSPMAWWLAGSFGFAAFVALTLTRYWRACQGSATLHP